MSREGTGTTVSPARRRAALVAQIFSFATTVNLVAWIMQPDDEIRWGVTLLIAIGIEVLFYGMKETLLDDLWNPMGWLGVLLDGITNAGGMLGFAGRFLSFGPVSLTMALSELNTGDVSVQVVSTFGLSLVLGIGLALAPHLLRRQRKSR